MRVSIFKDSPYYDPACVKCVPTLDGVEETNCVEADTDEGWLIRYAIDSHGDNVIRHGELVKERVFGEVKLYMIYTGATA